MAVFKLTLHITFKKTVPILEAGFCHDKRILLPSVSLSVLNGALFKMDTVQFQKCKMRLKKMKGAYLHL